MSAESLWLPGSRCDTRCLPQESRSGLALRILAAIRLVGVVVILVAAVLLSPLFLLWGRWIGRHLARLVLATIGVRHQRRGRPPTRTALVAANHVSWLDILVLLAHIPVRLVAKAQVRQWPIIGWLAATAGTIFVDRSRPRALPGTVAQLAKALRGGHTVAIFPEGTTWCGRAGGRFRPAMFQAAIDAGVPVVPVSLRYRCGEGESTTVAAFLGEDTLMASLTRVARVRRLRVSLDIHPSLYPEPGADRTTLSSAAHSAVHRCRLVTADPGMSTGSATPQR